MARIYANENFRRPIVEVLESLGHDVLTSLRAGNANLGVPDEEVMAFAKQENRILITFNRKHFIRLHKFDPIHSGIIVCTEDSDFHALALRIHNAIIEHKENLENLLVRVNRPN